MERVSYLLLQKVDSREEEGFKQEDTLPRRSETSQGESQRRQRNLKEYWYKREETGDRTIGCSVKAFQLYKFGRVEKEKHRYGS